ncbi:hypothetical protein UFOVP29_38 [uncultured Caudovirales phage]|uniref:Uncharacterized protein n=1 Tax=uncultured Caudovirales phage TaxID=2100421 RepID=A0A6J5KMU5_9CAUD|nr:hypothetical protein UFOVP29_38 [uncultured Caudovirales phage]
MNETDIKCLTTLVSFLTRNPQIINTLYGDPELQKYVQDPNHWKMGSSCKMTLDHAFPYEDRVGIYREGATPNRYGEATGTIPYKDVRWARYFYVADEMSDLGMLVYELRDGTIVVGTHSDCDPGE